MTEQRPANRVTARLMGDPEPWAPVSIAGLQCALSGCRTNGQRMFVQALYIHWQLEQQSREPSRSFGAARRALATFLGIHAGEVSRLLQELIALGVVRLE